ncbi:hypothetical protein CPB84DRAFT_1964831 [Gymnopilus junonius]|uniref:J domain-containing protein n=1 Tax=Gymnopilus junonius TaxID=109634 RepID=A0A9P5TJH3_GYMJU|nr:hypothetical protein CPB84DRAFT_1964831 [Gymnopilus junonius]
MIYSPQLHSIGLRVPFGCARRCSCTRHLISKSYATISSGAAEVEKPLPPLKNPFPYPRASKPTPYQIFHLSSGATQPEIKARYYELVKAHHPDSQYASHLSPDVAHERFRAIQAAYDFLRGKTVSPHPNARPSASSTGFDPYLHEMARRRRAYYAYHRYPRDGSEDGRWAKPGWGEGFGAPASERTVWHEDGWRERMILAFGMMTFLAGMFPSMPFTILSMFTGPSVDPSMYTHPPPTPSPPERNGSESSSGASASTPNSENSFRIPFIDLDKSHREAVSALQQVRSERNEIGPERREGVRKRVRVMSTDPQAQSPPNGGRNVSEDVMPTGPTNAGAIDNDKGNGAP